MGLCEVRVPTVFYNAVHNHRCKRCLKYFYEMNNFSLKNSRNCNKFAKFTLCCQKWLENAFNQNKDMQDSLISGGGGQLKQDDTIKRRQLQKCFCLN